MRFDWNRARAFLVTAEEGSLSAAARALGMTQPTLGRQVSALEEELGVALFERAGRGLELTPNGLELVEHVREMGAAANRVSLAASGQSQTIEGTVTITTTEVSATYTLPPLLARLRAEQPGIRIEFIASNSISDLRRREADIAIRSVRPTDPDLYAVRLRDNTACMYATHGYLESIGNPETSEALAQGTFLGFDENERYIGWLNSLGLPVSSRNFPVICANHVAQWQLVLQGMGVGGMLEEIGDAEPRVRRAAPWIEPLPFEVWLVSHRELKTSRRVRLVFDWLHAALGPG